MPTPPLFHTSLCSRSQQGSGEEGGRADVSSTVQTKKKTSGLHELQIEKKMSPSTEKSDFSAGFLLSPQLARSQTSAGHHPQREPTDSIFLPENTILQRLSGRRDGCRKTSAPGSGGVGGGGSIPMTVQISAGECRRSTATVRSFRTRGRELMKNGIKPASQSRAFIVVK